LHFAKISGLMRGHSAPLGREVLVGMGSPDFVRCYFHVLPAGRKGGGLRFIISHISEGVVYIELDSAGAWKTKLAQELVQAKMTINIKGLISWAALPSLDVLRPGALRTYCERIASGCPTAGGYSSSSSMGRLALAKILSATSWGTMS
jgi:hypothetical protein